MSLDQETVDEVGEYEKKIKQEEMIKEAILRIIQQYTDVDSSRSAIEKLKESERRIKYLKGELDRIIGGMVVESPISEHESNASRSQIGTIMRPFYYIYF